ncbi:MAG: aspartate-semialdehyde dehydrogenase [Candidatus Pacebacteria bacterium]|nr:aspartate-semialdehyde dehydrogenase [Candidatus Paceibacterota bacterium]
MKGPVGFVGWRGMVGSVLMQRMLEENDFVDIPERHFFSTSQVGQKGPDIAEGRKLEDANSVEALKKCEIIVTCQGGDWTKEMYPKIRADGWKGIWIDAASTLRMDPESVIVLDPINGDLIKKAISDGCKTFVGGNCTVSLMLMACHGLFKNNLVEWVSSMTYQAASGAGAKHMQELIRQMKFIGEKVDPATTALELDRIVTERMDRADFPKENFGAPLAGSLIPWIDIEWGSGRTKEEWKGYAEANKILGTKTPIPIDGLCVRVGAMRCHSQALLIKLTRDVPLDKLKFMIGREANEWAKYVFNDKKETLASLTPAAVSGTLDVAIGRLHKAMYGPEYLLAFTVGDQLLWGAAEPVRRTLQIFLGNL